MRKEDKKTKTFIIELCVLAFTLTYQISASNSKFT